MTIDEGRDLTTRIADRSDLAAIEALMVPAIRELQKPFLDREEIAASFDIMGLDRQLIDDGTYHLVHERDALVGCGGWSFRATRFGGSHSSGRDDSRLDPAHDAARIRAMYTHPAHTRRGIGRLVLATCEAAASAAGFQRFELVATLAGEPLYRACGYRVVENISAPTSSALTIEVRRMVKP